MYFEAQTGRCYSHLFGKRPFNSMLFPYSTLPSLLGSLSIQVNRVEYRPAVTDLPRQGALSGVSGNSLTSLLRCLSDLHAGVDD